MKKSSIRALFDALPHPAILVGSDERVQAANEHAQSLLKISDVGRHYITVLRQPTILDVIEQTLSGGGQHSCSYITGTDHRDVIWQVTVSAVEDADQPRAALLMFEDITAREQAGQMRRDFVTNVSHELRTPLTAVLGFVETLLGAARDDPEARDRFLGIIDREATRMSQLVEDLLSLSRVEDQERRRPSDPVELVSLIQSSIAGLQPLTSRQNVTIEFTPPAADVTVPGDAGQLAQVLTNLLENAIKYGGSQRTVTVSLSLPQHEDSLRAKAVRLSVTDRGEGIAAHHIPRLTERFYRLDSHRSRNLGGTGLGLAIVKHILSRHRGRLRIASTPGQGSTFTAILPSALDGVS